MRNILVHVHGDQGQEARLAVALDLVRALDGHLSCAQVTPYGSFVGLNPFGGLYLDAGSLAREAERESVERGVVEQQLDAAGVAWDWINTTGAEASALLNAAALADLVVIGRADREFNRGEPLSLTADVVIHSRSPVLVVPTVVRRFDAGGHALIAWNGGLEVAQALRSAVPLLRHAASVALVRVAEDHLGHRSAADAVAYLGWHGIAAEVREVDAGDRAIDETLLDEIEASGAGYVIAGAYGHSRLREYLLGGVTRSLLRRCPVPLLLSH